MRIRTQFATITLLLSSLLWLPATTTAAPLLTSVDLQADCADGAVQVSGHQRYVGGGWVDLPHCVVSLLEGATLELIGVGLRGSESFIVKGSVSDATVRIDQSKFEFEAYVELNPGCCAVKEREYRGKLEVSRSSITARAIQLGASWGGKFGEVVVTDSLIKATGPSGITIQASTSATGGLVFVKKTQLLSAGRIHVVTGQTGFTAVYESSFGTSGPVTVSTGPGGSCTVAGNTPAVPCT